MPRFVRQEFVAVTNRKYLEAVPSPIVSSGILAGLGALPGGPWKRSGMVLCPGVQAVGSIDVIRT